MDGRLGTLDERGASFVSAFRVWAIIIYIFSSPLVRLELVTTI
jgi:hypothetical protein